jgi:glycolate oxidase iron-sulfur subunit
VDSGLLEKNLAGCVRCGRCLSVCPIYRETGREGGSARGKLALLKADLERTADLAGRMKDLLSACLGCGACAEICVNEVRADELIQAGRGLALSGGGLEALRRLLARDLLSRGRLTRTALKGRSVWLKSVPPESGLRVRFPLPGLDQTRWLPPLADPPFLERPRPEQQTVGNGPTVALFVGCVSNFLRPADAAAAVRVLEAAGATVVVPSGQVCCGKPAFSSGDEETAAWLARRNQAVFEAERCDFLVAPCATCSAHLKSYGPFAEPKWKGRVRDLSEFLVNDLGWSPRPATPERSLRVFFHDPCHLRRRQGVWREPRTLIEALPGVELVGRDLPPACCGHGGLFNLWHYDLSQAIFARRAETAAPLEPDVIVTSCSGCLLQFEDGRRRLGWDVRVASLAELLDGRAGEENDE